MIINEYLELYNEDNMKLMYRYPDNHFDLAIVDPEYGININNNIGRRKGDKHSGHKKVNWDSKIPSDNYFKELFRVSKNQIIWGGNYFPYLWKNGCKGFIIWDKLFSDEVSFSMYEMAWTSFDITSKGFKYSPQKDKNKIHPTQKSQHLYSWLLKNYSKPNDKILDTHLGSASIAIAIDSVNKIEGMNLTLTACELDKEYFDESIKRVKSQTSWTPTFKPEPIEVKQTTLL